MFNNTTLETSNGWQIQQLPSNAFLVRSGETGETPGSWGMLCSTYDIYDRVCSCRMSTSLMPRYLLHWWRLIACFCIGIHRLRSPNKPLLLIERVNWFVTSNSLQFSSFIVLEAFEYDLMNCGIDHIALKLSMIKVWIVNSSLVTFCQLPIPESCQVVGNLFEMEVRWSPKTQSREDCVWNVN